MFSVKDKLSGSLVHFLDGFDENCVALRLFQRFLVERCLQPFAGGLHGSVVHPVRKKCNRSSEGGNYDKWKCKRSEDNDKGMQGRRTIRLAKEFLPFTFSLVNV